MDANLHHDVSRTRILRRLLITVVAFIALEITVFILHVSALFQYLMLLILRQHSESLRLVNNGLARYGYKLMRYASLNDNARPFPFAPLPKDAEEPQDPNFE